VNGGGAPWRSHPKAANSASARLEGIARSCAIRGKTYAVRVERGAVAVENRHSAADSYDNDIYPPIQIVYAEVVTGCCQLSPLNNQELWGENGVECIHGAAAVMSDRMGETVPRQK